MDLPDDVAVQPYVNHRRGSDEITISMMNVGDALTLSSIVIQRGMSSDEGPDGGRVM